MFFNYFFCNSKYSSSFINFTITKTLKDHKILSKYAHQNQFHCQRNLTIFPNLWLLAIDLYFQWLGASLYKGSSSAENFNELPIKFCDTLISNWLDSFYNEDQMVYFNGSFLFILLGNQIQNNLILLRMSILLFLRTI
jgi:hypothetical protein